MLLLLVNEREIETTLTKEPDQFVFLKFVHVQLLDKMKFFQGATTRGPEAYKTSRTEKCFPYDCFDNPKKLRNTQLPPYQALFGRLETKYPHDKDNSGCPNLLVGGITAEEA